jgi:uncharacterized protein with von Willebrand factor type A (vWA) domain
MLAGFLEAVRSAGIPATLREYLTLLEGLQAGVCGLDVEEFYHFARLTLVKHEGHFDRFDQAFATHFQGALAADTADPSAGAQIPEDWLRALAERVLGPEERARIEALGGFDKLMETLRQRLAEQEGRHEGGSKWIGTGGTSPFGAHGYNPEGVRIGQDRSRHRRAVKVWDRREFRDFDDNLELGARNLKVALRRLRRFAREGPAEQLDLGGTLRATADNAGYLDIRLVPEWRNRIKILLFLDVGGSMDDHVRTCELLFSAARSEFRHLEHFYFHNCVYESVWRSNLRRDTERIPVFDLMHRYGRDWRVIFVGDAHMGPSELMEPGGSSEHWNEESGRVWLDRLAGHFTRNVWLNPMPEPEWEYSSSAPLVRRILDGRMLPLTPDGITRAARLLR